MDIHYAEHYENLYYHHWWWRAREKFVGQWLDSLDLAAGGKILDIGCGGGWGFEKWRKYGEVWGVEPSQALVDRSGARFSRIHCGSFDHHYRPDEQFTLILMLDVLEHLATPLESLQHARDLLEPDGTMLITVPAMPSLWTSHDDLNHHFVRYTKPTLEQVVEQAGLRIDRIEYFFRWVTVPKFLVRCKERIFATEPQNPKVPASLLNQFFYALTVLEQSLIGRVPLPFGTSLVCVCRK